MLKVFRAAVVLAPLLVLGLRLAVAQPPVRELEEVSLDVSGTWKIAFDPGNVGLSQAWFKTPPWKMQDIRVPSCFEEIGEGAGYDGVVWYFHRFNIPADFAGKALYLEFDAVNYACRAWLNGTEIGSHIGGYHRFRFSLGTAARIGGQTNDLVVRVVDPGHSPIDGLTLRSIPNGKESWYFNFGGIYRPVRLVGKPSVSIEDIFVIGDARTGKVSVQLEIEKRGGAAADSLLEVRISPKEQSDRPVTSNTQKLLLQQGANRATAELMVREPNLWSLSRPYLYQLTATLGKASRRSVTFGFRSFEIKDGRFWLNDQPIVLKAVLYQPYYPMTLAYPPSRDFVGGEVRTIKQHHFNMIRFHSAVAPPEFLDECDKQGLLVLEEPSLGWVSGPLDQIAEPSLEEVAAMVRRDRNHPSVVAWGTISQGGGDLGKIGELLARRALQLDGTRPVFGDWPGQWVEAYERACLVYLPDRNEPLAMAGGQIFPGTPVSKEDYTLLNTLGTSASLVFLSAVGPGGAINPAAALSQFQGREYLEDYQQLRRYRDQAQEDFERYNLNRMPSDVGDMVNFAQRSQAAAAFELIQALRANPNVDGYCYSQWRDAAWESGPGIFGKPSMEAVRAANQPVQLSVWCEPRVIALDQAASVTAHVVNEDGALSGRCRVEFRLRREDGRDVWHQRVPVQINPSDRVTPVEVAPWKARGNTGRYSLLAELFDASGNRVAFGERWIVVVDSDSANLSRHDLLVIEPEPRIRGNLAAAGVQLVSPPSRANSRVSLVSGRSRAWESRSRFEPVAEVLEGISREGGTLLVDCSRGVDEALGRVQLFRGKTVNAAGGFLGRFMLVPAGAPIYWLGRERLDAFRSVFPTLVLRAESRDWRPYAALVGNYGQVLGYAWAEKQWGAGQVVVLTWPIFERMDRDPAARLLCGSLLTHYKENWRTGSPGNHTKAMLLAQFEGGGETAASEWWVCGPFSCRDLSDGLQQIYPPEQEFQPERSYPGKDAQNARWKRYRCEQAGFINFIDAFGPQSNAVAYALIHIRCKQKTETTLRLGSDDAVKVFLNGRAVHENAATRSAAPDQDRVAVTLQEGWNRLLLKVVNGQGEWQARVAIDEPVNWSLDERVPQERKR